MTQIHTPLLIVGSGPAGYTAAIYAARASIDTIVIAGMQVGGQLTQTAEIENFPGFPEKLSGGELMDKMREQAETLGAKIIEDVVTKIDFSTRPFVVTLDSEKIYTCDSLILATGASPRWLSVENEEELRGFGVSACATCDGFFYRNKKVAVIGGGNTAVDEALYLSKLASEVYLIHRRDSLKAEKVMQDRVLNNPKIKVIWDSVVEAYVGEKNKQGLTGLALKNLKTGEKSELTVDGAFVAVGYVPNTELFKSDLTLDEQGFLVTKKGTPLTEIEGVFAAGDVQEIDFRQAITAAAGGCRAALMAEKYLSSL